MIQGVEVTIQDEHGEERKKESKQRKKSIIKYYRALLPRYFNISNI